MEGYNCSTKIEFNIIYIKERSPSGLFKLNETDIIYK